MSEPWTGQWIDFDLEEATLRSDYDVNARVPQRDPWRGTRQHAEPATHDPDWMDRAACKGQTRIMYPHESTKQNIKYRKLSLGPARKVCSLCPVKAECLDYAMTLPVESIRHGVWAGMDRWELEAERRRRGLAGPYQPIVHGTHRGYRAHLDRAEEACRECLAFMASENRRRGT